MLKVQLVGPNGRAAEINQNGALITLPQGESRLHSVNLDVDDQVYNLLKPVPGYQAVITSLLFIGNREIGASDATVELYEATSASSATISATLINMEIAKNSAINMVPLNINIDADKPCL